MSLPPAGVPPVPQLPPPGDGRGAGPADVAPAVCVGAHRRRLRAARYRVRTDYFTTASLDEIECQNHLDFDF